jgi:hypothetical protein
MSPGAVALGDVDRQRRALLGKVGAELSEHVVDFSSTTTGTGRERYRFA